MIRDKIGIRRIFPIFWKECYICKKEFKLERGWKVTINGPRPLVYFICGRCKTSHDEVLDYIKRRSRPPGSPPPPAPSPLMYRRRL